MELMGSTISTHVYLVYIFFAIMIFNLYSVVTMDNHIKLARRLKFMTPIYHLCNAVIMYTGAIVTVYAPFSITIVLMIPTSIFLMVIEIKRYKKMRVIKSDDIDLQIEFKSYAKKIYMIEIAVLILVYIVSKVF